MFEGFRLEMIDTGETVIRARIGGHGPPLLLLHGAPQTHLMWHRIAPALAERFTVVAADLRGYGESGKPASTPDHGVYGKRAMARDQVALMRSLGFASFNLAGHDRGGRCAYRLALDHPAAVLRLAVLDILPTYEHFRRADMDFALAYWHWFFLAQPFDLPERMIGAMGEEYCLRGRRHLFAPEALDDYLRCFRNPETVHAICEDYRAGASYDCELDRADLEAGRKIGCPLLVLWGEQNAIHKAHDPLAVWRGWADDVRGEGLPCGHYLPEEAPEATLGAFVGFFGS